MADQIIEERELSIEDYLRLFEEGSADFELVKKRSANLARIVVKLVEASGRRAEDTTFIEKTGVQYTVRSYLD